MRWTASMSKFAGRRVKMSEVIFATNASFPPPPALAPPPVLMSVSVNSAVAPRSLVMSALACKPNASGSGRIGNWEITSR